METLQPGYFLLAVFMSLSYLNSVYFVMSHVQMLSHLNQSVIPNSNISPGEGDVTSGHFFQVIDRRRLASEAVVGVVVGHDGGGPQLTEFAVRTLQLQLNRLQFCVFTPVHWGDENERGASFHY